jgi:quercetin dioxygenase-like cupin family protein
MEIKRSGSQPSGKGPADYFTGAVRIDPLNNPPEPARVSMALVTFEPGARTAWHTHPLGQTLIVTSGCGWVQREGAPIEEIRPGDVIWFAPEEKHWHGASPTDAVIGSPQAKAGPHGRSETWEPGHAARRPCAPHLVGPDTARMAFTWCPVAAPEGEETRAANRLRPRYRCESSRGKKWRSCAPYRSSLS